MINNKKTLLKFGNKKIKLELTDKNILGVLSAKETKPLKNPISKLEELFEKSINVDSLDKLIRDKKAKKILIIVNDLTRPTPYHVLLPPLLTKLCPSRNSKTLI